MDDFLEQTAVRQKKGGLTVLYYLTWVVIIVLALITVIAISSVVHMNEEGGLAFNWMSLLIALPLGAAAFLLWRQKDNLRVEYDYSFTNGTLDISKVMNDRRRRYLCSLEVKDVIRCGPAKGPAFNKSLSEPGVKRHNWFVNREAPLTFFYFSKNNVKHLAVMELSDEMIAVMRSKSNYIPRSAWYEADGTQRYGSGIS